MYPLKMVPFFRHGEATPWGGTALRNVFGKQIPDDTTGESLEISALDGKESVVANGEFAGKNLKEMIELWGTDLTGLPEGTVFPLLLKLLDASGMLSVQVHPDDTYAGEHDNGKLGKTEAWVVLDAPRGAKLVYGIKDTMPLREAVEQGKLEDMLEWVNVLPGDVLYIPHGMVHALGGSVLVYEIQQSSDVTYRFWDWGRIGKDGKPRELHMEKALDVSRQDLHLNKLYGSTVLCKGGSRTAYICDSNFELWRLNVAGNMPLESGRMLFLTALGVCKLHWGEETLEMLPGESVLVPAALEGVSIEGRLSVLCSCLPDQDAMRECMGYRADSVAGLKEI